MAGKASQRDSARQSAAMPVKLPIKLRAFLTRRPEQIRVSFPAATIDNRKADRPLDAISSTRRSRGRSAGDL